MSNHFPSTLPAHKKQESLHLPNCGEPYCSTLVRLHYFYYFYFLYSFIVTVLHFNSTVLFSAVSIRSAMMQVTVSTISCGIGMKIRNLKQLQSAYGASTWVSLLNVITENLKEDEIPPHHPCSKWYFDAVAYCGFTIQPHRGAHVLQSETLALRNRWTSVPPDGLHFSFCPCYSSQCQTHLIPACPCSA